MSEQTVALIHENEYQPSEQELQLLATLDMLSAQDRQVVEDASAEHLARLQERLDDQGQETAPVDSVTAPALYSDHTLAGQLARMEANRSGLTEQLVQAHNSLQLASGMAADDAETSAGHYRNNLLATAAYAQEKYDRSVLPGDIRLEHYTPLALDVLGSGGLRPKADHGVSTTNNGSRSEQVHFTSNGGHPGHIDYRQYIRPNSRLAQYVGQHPDARPLAGQLSINLADVLQQGYSSAVFTTKQVNGVNLIDDIALAGPDGQPAMFPTDSLDLEVIPFGTQYAANPQVIYDHALHQRLQALRESYGDVRHEIGWQEYVAAGLDKTAVAKEALRATGLLDADWIEDHASVIEDRPPSESSDTVIVPLALASSEALKYEIVDGDSRTAQQVRLGVVRRTV